MRRPCVEPSEAAVNALIPCPSKMRIAWPPPVSGMRSRGATRHSPLPVVSLYGERQAFALGEGGEAKTSRVRAYSLSRVCNPSSPPSPNREPSRRTMNVRRRGREGCRASWLLLLQARRAVSPALHRALLWEREREATNRRTFPSLSLRKSTCSPIVRPGADRVPF